MTKLSVVINTLNEEKNLPKALSSIKPLKPELIIVDMHSDDKTVEIAKKAGAKIYSHERTNYVEPARNFAISKASGEWVLILDADEELTPDLCKKIKELINKEEINFYRIPRKNIVFGKWLKYSRWWPDYNVRLFKKGSVSWGEIIHGVPVTLGKGENMEPKEELAIKHNHYETIEQFITRLNRYTTEQAKSLIKKGYKFDWTDLISKPAGEFLSRYFAGEGYKDGIHGLSLSGLQAFSEFVLYLKVWQAESFAKKDLSIKEVVEELKKAEKEFHYWQSDTEVKNNGGVISIIKRKFKL